MAANDDFTSPVKECRQRLSSAAIADALDSLGYPHQALSPAIARARQPGAAGVGVGIGDLAYSDIDGTLIVPRATLRAAPGTAFDTVAAENVVPDRARACGTRVGTIDRHGNL